jgi:hypothetical protein
MAPRKPLTGKKIVEREADVCCPKIYSNAVCLLYTLGQVEWRACRKPVKIGMITRAGGYGLP